jgi:DnaJ-class molecular chaperone
MNVKAGADTGTKMRLKGKGVPARGGVAAGDLIVTLAVHVGKAGAALEEFLKENQAVAEFDPRVGMVP